MFHWSAAKIWFAVGFSLGVAAKAADTLALEQAVSLAIENNRNQEPTLPEARERALRDRPEIRQARLSYKPSRTYAPRKPNTFRTSTPNSTISAF